MKALTRGDPPSVWVADNALCGAGPVGPPGLAPFCREGTRCRDVLRAVNQEAVALGVDGAVPWPVQGDFGTLAEAVQASPRDPITDLFLHVCM